MADYTAVIEDSIFTYEVKANINQAEDDANPYEVWFGGEQMSRKQTIHFINTYGVADLTDEILAQYRIEIEAHYADKVGYEWEIKQLEGRTK